MDSPAPNIDDPRQILRDISRNPVDLGLRLRLGAALSVRGDYGGAIPELEKAMFSPYLRWQSMRLLIEAYEATGQHGLAERMRERLSKETGGSGDSGPAPVPV